MRIKAMLLLLGMCAAACSALGQRPQAPTRAVPTFSLNLPTGTPLPPTLVPIMSPTPTSQVGWPVATITIVSSLPMSGPSQSTSQAFVNAETLRLQQANYLACNGKYKLALQALDDSSKKANGWDPNLETVNVGTATENA